MKRNFLKILLTAGTTLTLLSGCSFAFFGNEVNEMSGSIFGNEYHANFYSNNGEKFMEMSGEKIDLSSNIVEEAVYTGDGWGYVESMSSVVTITIDGNDVQSCGSTVIFCEDGLNAEVDFNTTKIESNADSVLDNTIISKTVNKYKNYFGKSRVVVIQSQLGNPICAYSGDDVYWEVCKDLPKTTKLMIDGKALYIHRANFQIFDKELLV